MAQYIYQDAATTKKPTLLAQTFTWVLIGLLITSAIGVGLALFINAILAGATLEAQKPILTNYLIAVGISAVVQLILVFYIQFSVIRRGPMGKNITVPYIIYTANMGILISALLVMYSFEVMALALAVTVILFAMMALFARQTKANLSGLAIVGVALLVGSLILMLINIFLRSTQLEWILSFVLFGAIMLITLFDIWQVTKASKAGLQSKNLALFFAFNIYIDFIYILIRVAYFIGLSRRN